LRKFDGLADDFDFSAKRALFGRQRDKDAVSARSNEAEKDEATMAAVAFKLSTNISI